ncbi:hypothetical protein LCGC14_0838180 [marine sediment metagenome]|uniref:Uncharacterized protein n=1 Tax=marine sediment metagenome TaxID=412755 RepID=A0A0F9RYJ3_9ZZZZ
MTKKKIKDINIPIKLKVEKLTKELVYNQFSKQSNIEFHGELILDVFGKKINIGYIMTDSRYDTISDLMQRVKDTFLSHIRYFNVYIREF